jgi:hypothetical protein
VAHEYRRRPGGGREGPERQSERQGQRGQNRKQAPFSYRTTQLPILLMPLIAYSLPGQLAQTPPLLYHYFCLPP